MSKGHGGVVCRWAESGGREPCRLTYCPWRDGDPIKGDLTFLIVIIILAVVLWRIFG